MNKRHLISIEDLTKSEILHLVQKAEFFLKTKRHNILESRSCFNIFFEESTRTISSFFSAFSSLGGSVLNISTKFSSASKGETDFDTILNLSKLDPKFLSIRHKDNMFSHICSNLENINKESIIINAGDGTNEHPTQALGDFFLINDYIKKTNKKLEDLKIVLFGDLKRSRVAHSHIKLFNMFGLNKNIYLVSPIEFSLNYEGLYDGLNYYLNLNKDVLSDADIIMGFRFKNEYDNLNVNNLVNNEFVSVMDLKNFYQLNMKNIIFAKKDVMVLHPGPVNREIEISSELIDNIKYSYILKQVEYGLAMRKAIIEFLFKINDSL
jgi:aspartate carbamoyltransferase catalytic subunit